MAKLFLALMGPQGSGKGTQAEFLRDHFSIPTFSFGATAREEVEKGTPLGIGLKKIMDRGELAPKALAASLVKRRLAKPDMKNGVIFDGYPRDLVQYEMLESVLDLSAMIVLEITDRLAITRLSHRLVCARCAANYNTVSLPPRVEGRCDRDGGALVKRSDDKPAAVRRRLQIYHTETEPIIHAFEKIGPALRVSGDQPMVEVHEAIILRLEGVGIRKKKKR